MNIMALTAILLAIFAGVSGCATWQAERAAPMLGQKLQIPGGSAHVFSAGPRESEHPPVILIHGASVNLRDMKMSLGDALSQDRFVVMIDRPGRGYSSRPQDGHKLSVQAQYIHDVVTALELENPIVVGQSLGGAVALRYALEYQNEMRALVLLAPVSHEWPGGVAWYNRASGVPVLGFLLRRLFVPIYGALAVNGGVEASFAPDSPPDEYVEKSGLKLLFRASDFKANAADIANLKREVIEQQGRYDQLNLPVAIITGVDDTTVSPSIHSKTLAKEAPGAALTLLEDTGHALHHSQTARIVAEIKRLSAPASASPSD